MNATLVLIFAVFVTVLVLLEGILAYRDGLFSVQQMRDRGFTTGLPFVFHGAMWTNLLIINPVMIISLLLYSQQWRLKYMLVIATVMFLVTTAMHFAYAMSKTPDCLAWNGKLTPAGCVHWFYQGLGLTVVGLIYFGTQHVDPHFLITVSALLAVHIFAGTQMFLNIFRPSWWGKTVATDWGSVLTILVVWGLLGWRCYHILNS